MVDPVPLIIKLFEFLFDRESIDGTVLERRIQQICGGGISSKTHVYTLKQGTGKLYRSLHLYTSEQLERIKTLAGRHLHFFEFSQPDKEEPDGTKYFKVPDFGATYHDHNKGKGKGLKEAW